MIPITQPLLGREEADAAHATVLSGWVSQGQQVAEFESEFAAEVGADYCCAVSNCTTALHLALLAAGVRPGGEVITVSHSFIAGPNSVRQIGATPVFVDIEPAGFNIDPEAIAAAATARTQAILCVHQMGTPCDIGPIVEIARRIGVPLIEDAACAIGAEVRVEGQWRRIGHPFGDIVCFSLHPRKVITVGEGGMLTTNRPEHDGFFRLARQHGMSVPDAVRHASPQVIFESYAIPGFNYRMTDMQAAIGREQLKRLRGIVTRRRALAARYAVLLDRLKQVEPPHEPDWARSNWQSYPVRLAAELDQRAVMQHMLDHGVATRRGIMCAHREPAYANLALRFPLPRSEEAQDGTILLPLYPQMTSEQQQQVVAALRRAVTETARRSGALPRAI